MRDERALRLARAALVAGRPDLRRGRRRRRAWPAGQAGQAAGRQRRPGLRRRPAARRQGDPGVRARPGWPGRPAADAVRALRRRGQGSIADLKLQPDGLYFTDLYLDDGDGGPSRARRQGLAHPPRRRADFTASAVAGAAAADRHASPTPRTCRRRAPRLGLRRRRRQRRGQPVAHLHAAGALRRHRSPAPASTASRSSASCSSPSPTPTASVPGPGRARAGPGAARAADRRLPGDGRRARRRLQAVLGGQRRPDDLRLPDHRRVPRAQPGRRAGLHRPVLRAGALRIPPGARRARPTRPNSACWGGNSPIGG